MFWSVPQWACLLIVTFATSTDLACRRIPNWITIPAITGAFIYQVFQLGLAQGLVQALIGLAVGCALLLFPFLKGGMGGGDVKLLGALGAWMGHCNVLNIFIYSAWAGALWALFIMVRHKMLFSKLRELWTSMVLIHAPGKIQRPPRAGKTIPYAVAIAAGYLVFLSYGCLI